MWSLENGLKGRPEKYVTIIFYRAKIIQTLQKCTQTFHELKKNIFKIIKITLQNVASLKLKFKLFQTNSSSFLRAS